MFDAQKVREEQVQLMGIIPEFQELIKGAILSGYTSIMYHNETLTLKDLNLLHRFLLDKGFKVQSYTKPQELEISWL